MTLRDALLTATARLREVPELREEAAEDATLLLLHVLGVSRTALLTGFQHEFDSPLQEKYESLIARRLRHEPVQYITGEREFYGLPIKVTPAVLIPRNLTEHLVEAVVAELVSRDRAGAALRIVDVGTGSGAIAIALALHLPHAEITALDFSAEALGIAAGNAEANAVATRICLLHSDILSAVAAEPPFDAIVSNPPYIRDADRSTLAPQVREFEPAGALFAGGDGLVFYRRLIPQAFSALKRGGLLALEYGPGQHTAMDALLQGWSDLRLVEDFDRTPRIVLARKP